MDHKNNIAQIENNISRFHLESDYHRKNKDFVTIEQLIKTNKTNQSLDILNYIIEKKNEYLVKWWVSNILLKNYK